MSEEIREQVREDEEAERINLLDYFIVLAKRKKLILYITLFSAIIAFLLSLRINPSLYYATTTMLPPERGRGINIASRAILSQFAGLLGAGSNVLTGQDLYLELLNSRTLYDRIIDRFDLMKVSESRLFGFFEDKTRERIRQNLDRKVMIEPDNRGISKLKNLAMNTRLIKITIRDKDPKKAADMANAFAEELKKFVRELETADATEKRIFFENQLKQAKEALNISEDNMKKFMEDKGILEVDKQAAVIIESMSRLRAEITAKEVELNVMKSYSTFQNPDMQIIEDTIKALKSELKKLEAKGIDESDTLLSTREMPEIGTEYARKLRDFKYNEKLFELIASQVEAARMDELNEAVQIQIIDKAIPPEVKTTKKSRIREVLKGAFLGFFFSIFAAFFVEYVNRQSKIQKNREKLETIKDYLSLKK